MSLFNQIVFSIEVCDTHLDILEFWIEFNIRQVSWSMVTPIYTEFTVRDSKFSFVLGVTSEDQNT